MRSPLERSISRLSIGLTQVTVSRYARAPIPSDEDVLVEELLGDLDAASGEAPELQRYVRTILFAFSIRSASRAVRENEPKHLVRAVAALRYASAATGDWRDLVDCVCVLYDASRRLGIDPRFALAHAGGNASLRKAIQTMLKLPPDKIKIEKYGFGESSDADGFRYGARRKESRG
jgi:hypothetical protein